MRVRQAVWCFSGKEAARTGGGAGSQIAGMGRSLPKGASSLFAT